MFTPESFDRLVAISRHPVVSKNVKSIYYEPDMLTELDYATWESRLFSKNFLDDLPILLPDSTEIERRYHDRRRAAFDKKPRHTYSKAVFPIFLPIYGPSELPMTDSEGPIAPRAWLNAVSM